MHIEYIRISYLIPRMQVALRLQYNLCYYFPLLFLKFLFVFFCRNRAPVTNPWQCAVCGNYFRSIDGILEATEVVTCHKCQARVCRYRCSEQVHDLSEGWICNVCRRESSPSWFKGILDTIQLTSKKG